MEDNKLKELIRKISHKEHILNFQKYQLKEMEERRSNLDILYHQKNIVMYLEKELYKLKHEREKLKTFKQ